MGILEIVMEVFVNSTKPGTILKTCSIKLTFSFQLKEDELRDAVILVFANKQDMPNAMTAAELTNALNLNNMRNRRVSRNGLFTN